MTLQRRPTEPRSAQISHEVADRFERLVETLDEVTDVAHVTGRFDYALRVSCQDITRLALRTVVSRARPMTPAAGVSD